MELPKLIAVEDGTPSVVCEYDSLNEMMENAHLYTLLKQGLAYHIMYAGERIGGCMVKLSLIRVRENDLTYEFPACEISYLVLKENSRKKKVRVRDKEMTIGRIILILLMRKIKAWSQKIPIRYITIEAFDAKQLLNWYGEFGFQKYQRAGKGKEYLGNVSMLMDLIPGNDDINFRNERISADYSIRLAMLRNEDEEYYVKPHEIEFPMCLLKRCLWRLSDENALETLQKLWDSLKPLPIRFFMIETFPGLEHWCQSHGFQKYSGNEYPNAMYRDSANLDVIDQYYG